MLIIALALIIPYFLIDKQKAAPNKFSSFGGKRLYLGLSGSMFAALLYCFCVGVLTGLDKVNLGHLPIDELIEKSIGYFLYIFALLGPFILVGVLLIGLPLMFVLLRMRLASHFGVFVVSMLLGSMYALFVVAFPYNNWCTSHPFECALDNFASIFIIALVVGVGFALGARLPLWKNEKPEK